MTEKLKQTIGFMAVIFGLPAIGAWQQATTWPVMVTILASMTLNLTQPGYRLSEIPNKNLRDRRSVLFLIVAGIIGLLIPYLDYLFGRKAAVTIDQPWSWVALVLVIGGLAFRIWSIRTLGKFFTATVEVQSDQRVIDIGPYRFLRHPSYAGAFAMYFGISILFRSYAGLAFMILAFFPVYTFRISAEETALATELGEPYQNYMKRSWRMLPFVY